MVSSLLLAALVAAQGPAEATAVPRKAFIACLRKLSDDNLQKKTDVAAFKTLAATACPTEAETLRSALRQSYIARKWPAGEAAETAGNDVNDFRANQIELYAELAKPQ